MSDAIWFRWRLILAALFGVALAMIVFYIAAGVALANGGFNGQQRATRDSIAWMSGAVNDYRTENKTFPPDLKTVFPGEANKPPLVDAWNRPLFYSTRGNRLLIESLGRDGVRGGVGLDADISNLSPRFIYPSLPLSQQLALPLGRTFAWSALAFGVLAAVLIFPLLGRIPVTSNSWGWLAVQCGLSFLLAALMASIGAVFIAVAHIPSGH